MPELPEVEALAQDLRGRLADRAIVRVDVAAFSALKTFDPPLSALHGTLVEDVTRHGKFLDVTTSGLHLVMHLSRGGWIRWRETVPETPPRPSNKSPLAARVVLDDGSGLDIIEAGTRKRLAIYVVRDPLEVPVGTTILEVLRAHGRKLPSSCESGTCGTCRTRYTAGEVDHRDMVLSPAERKNALMVCVSRATTDTLVLDL